MLERFGRLCGWIGNGVAILLIGFGIYVLANLHGNSANIYAGIFVVAMAIAAFLVGQAIRYVLVPREGDVSAGVLTKAQQLELQELEEQAMAEMAKSTPTYASTMAGAAFSGKIWAALDALFAKLEQDGQKMPEEFTLSISSEIPAALDATATAYLATDLFRPRGGWSLSAKRRALRRELQFQMDGRALLAAAYLRQARIYLSYGRVGKT